MKPDTMFRDGIKANLKALSHLLECAALDSLTAYNHICRNEQNLAIGTVMHVEQVLEQVLEQATVLYKAVIVLHRCKL
jgi:hypothetical protein